MKFSFVEFRGFTSAVQEYFRGDTQYAEFQNFLMEDPLAGDLLRGGGGVRKVRWLDPRRGKGKRGGLRVMYLVIPEVCRIYILDVYDKDEAEDLSSSELKVLAQLAQDIRSEELRRKRGKP